MGPEGVKVIFERLITQSLKALYSLTEVHINISAVDDHMFLMSLSLHHYTWGEEVRPYHIQNRHNLYVLSLHILEVDLEPEANESYFIH